MKSKLFILISVLCFIALFIVFANGRKRKNDPDYIRVAVVLGPEYIVAKAAQKVAKDRYGLDVELVTLTDYVVPNTLLDQGDVDLNAFQHVPYLENQMEERGYKLAVVGNSFVYPLAGYSKKIRSLDDLQDGSTIVIPNDLTNGGRALLLMQKYGLIRLKDNVGLVPRVSDIVENPRKFDIVELEAPQLPRVLDDRKVAVAIINNTYAAGAGLTLQDGIFIEDKDSPYVNVIVAREDNKNDDKVKRFVKAFQSEEVAATADREFKGGAVKGW
ncbi:methionine ABC transporter substrate-binding lipoprotein MetQ [Dysgonomonas macrotermitis]|uniref:Lipoprotein n=1 Tax=Dysgonomonas macrotermitis TaxID=1346286 RepID=A0A1M4UFV6_9BACT|nr:methionine ABC transporter substrate-binding lipoprotein MetQ [Dysgonomonas macrotermitis]SHE55682.1 D-methionine transport system substrate-binding protein [Dysgonomonas macrotermitis]